MRQHTTPASQTPLRQSPPPSRFIGCDVAKATIVVADTAGTGTTTLPNRFEPLVAFMATLDDTCLVVCEATGGYEDALLDAALAAGRAAHRADARKVKAFIRSFGILGKTDAIDAKALALYAAERHARLERWQQNDPQREKLQALVLIRRDLLAQRVAFSNRKGAPGAAPLARYIAPLLACLDEQIAAIDAEVAELMRVTKTLHDAERTLRTIAGIGAKTAAALLALLPELGRLDRRKIAALAGLAPHPSQSGATNAPRRTRGGRPTLKQVLFLPTLSAVRHDPQLAEAYKRLIANGKKPMVAIIAIMRKIVVIANARLRDLDRQKTADQPII